MKIVFLFVVLRIGFIFGNRNKQKNDLQNYYHEVSNNLYKQEEYEQMKTLSDSMSAKFIASVQNVCNNNSIFGKNNFEFLIDTEMILENVDKMEFELKKLALEITEIAKTRFSEFIKLNLNESFEFVTVLDKFIEKYNSELIHNIFNLTNNKTNENIANLNKLYIDYIHELEILFNLFKDFYHKFKKYEIFVSSCAVKKFNSVTTKFDLLKEINIIKSKTNIKNYKSLNFDKLESTYVILNVHYRKNLITNSNTKMPCLDNAPNPESFLFRFNEHNYLKNDFINLVISMYRLEITAINADDVKTKNSDLYEEAKYNYEKAIEYFLDDLHLIFNEIHNTQRPFSRSFSDYGIITTKYIISKILYTNENFTQATKYLFNTILSDNFSTSDKKELIEKYCNYKNEYKPLVKTLRKIKNMVAIKK